MFAMTLLIGSLLPSFTEATPLSKAEAATHFRVYVGTYTNKESKGIYLLELDTTTGKLESKGLAAESNSPSFLAIHPNKKFLYSVNEVSDFKGKSAGAVTSYSIDPKTGKLTQLNQQSTGGSGPCHLSVVRDGKVLVVANYGGGSVAALPINEDGTLAPFGSFIQHEGSSVNPGRQKEPHAHSINIDLDQKYVVAADLGLDKVLVYKLETEGAKLSPSDPAFAKVEAGSGPRHFAFHPDKKHAYVINEIKSTVTVFDYNGHHGILTPTQTISTLPNDFKGASYTAEVVVHPSGKFVYGSNRGHDSIAVFQVDSATGKLTAKGQVKTGGKTPRNFAIDPTGQFLLAENQDSGTIVPFRIDQETGTLTPTGASIKVPMPVCVKFLPID
jgi:6-phosphogluconolactonase